MTALRHKVCGVLLAGGLSRRMGGGDKSLKTLAGKPILTHVLERIRPQVACLVLNANGDRARFADWRVPVQPDTLPGHAGPLAGVLAGMEWAARHAPVCDLILTVPTDAPFLPRDLVDRLEEGMIRSGADIACAGSDGRAHPPIALWPVSLAEDLRLAMTQEEVRKVDVFTARYKLARVDWPLAPLDPFMNVNTPEDLARAEALAAEVAG
ncbi:molybdenum cofactor guanylyltransferase [Tistlia consotensis]|uniref:Molybdenum cofactor guanylyltransferase n=1 Tax=Tistlia consotensis USBA 355 TaxID=560819 RepID=A0A1Y6BR37_9PROT|nr:molybdenum cofactor guanylyltransferase MobA [Tistlia consotensis]SMF23789.1 molybdenum cofactor guanylyltransferase [Tistlia consotensis USBA 355]SNR61267.1 molybdenum cofactor guanylyltransferase [Tistlia consotensis]